MSDAWLVFLILGLALAGFVWGRIRYDLVALLALLAGVVSGVVPAEEAFLGFGHPAVVTVAAVLVLSRGFQHSGLVELLARQTRRVGGHVMAQLLVLTAGVALLSAFMNNVGALALLLPVALRMAREHRTPPSLLLMPLAFGSLLGGLMTLIGTPPNIILSNYRAQHSGAPYALFDFLPVGGAVTLAGVAFLVLAGWRLTPRRKGQASPDELFGTADYVSELTVTSQSRAAGWTLWRLGEALGEPVPVVAVVRGRQRTPGHAFHDALQAGDTLVVEAGPEELRLLEEKGGLKLGGKFAEKLADAEDLQLLEAVVRPESPLVHRTAAQLRLLDRHRLHLLAVARDGARLQRRLRDIRFRAGDVLLLQGDEADVAEALPELGCLPLASRDLPLGRPRRVILSVGLFAAAVAVMLLDWLPAAPALVLAAVATVLTRVLPAREIYRAVDWPVIVLLGALIPVGEALDTSGGAQRIADALLHVGKVTPPALSVAAVLLISLALSNVINNAAAAVLLAPVALNLAAGVGAAPDPFLMAVAVGASCPFLTPIGHQSNTLVLGPGGYRFGDYWKVGLPLTAVVVLVALPVILLVWPL